MAMVRPASRLRACSAEKALVQMAAAPCAIAAANSIDQACQGSAALASPQERRFAAERCVAVEVTADAFCEQRSMQIECRLAAGVGRESEVLSLPYTRHYTTKRPGREGCRGLSAGWGAARRQRALPWRT